eukprot:2113383-Amphidinium_carterae.1
MPDRKYRKCLRRRSDSQTQTTQKRRRQLLEEMLHDCPQHHLSLSQVYNYYNNCDLAAPAPLSPKEHHANPFNFALKSCHPKCRLERTSKNHSPL